MRLPRKGFVAYESLLMFLAGAIIVGTAWFVWDSKNQTNKHLDSASYASSTTAIPKLGAQSITYSQAPQGLQSALQTKAQINGCFRDGQIDRLYGDAASLPLTYIPTGFAIAGSPCGEGPVGLYVSIAGTWKFIEESQFGFNCSTLVNYGVPPQLLVKHTGDKAFCLDANGSVKTYK